MATDNTAAWQDELALIEAVLKGYPNSIAKADALRAVRVLQAIPPAARVLAVQELPEGQWDYCAVYENPKGVCNCGGYTLPPPAAQR